MRHQGMSTISDYVAARSGQSMGEIARGIGVSRPYLYGLLSGDRSPSWDMAKKIEEGTGGEVKALAWPAFSRVADAARIQGEGAA